MKKILISLAAILIVAAGVAAMSAGEAHIINVTAHIENALDVHPDELDFQTVFPEQYKELDLTIGMSESFDRAENADDIEYKIVQKPKCSIDGQNSPYYPVDRITHECPVVVIDNQDVQTKPLPLLCAFLSKLDGDPGDQNDTGVPSYFVAATSTPAYCQAPSPDMAIGKLAKSAQDLLDLWKIDLKVPPFEGYVAQDWPANCPVLDGDPSGTNYGCDLWIETTNISEVD